jgi:type 1 fimbriae regulatory protein FimB
MRDGRKHPKALEVNKLIAANRDKRNEARDRCFLLLMLRYA